MKDFLTVKVSLDEEQIQELLDYVDDTIKDFKAQLCNDCPYYIEEE